MWTDPHRESLYRDHHNGSEVEPDSGKDGVWIPHQYIKYLGRFSHCVHKKQQHYPVDDGGGLLVTG